MSNFTDFISSGGGGATVAFNVPITKSQTWTPPYNGVGTIHLIGAGGGGGGKSSGMSMSGGGGGGYCNKEVTFSTGTNWTFVIGARGGVASGNHSLATGSAGGNTTATDGTISLAANGGAGGLAGTAAGGTASGGTVNFSGGQSIVGGCGGAIGTQATGASSATGYANQWSVATADSDFIGPYDPLAYGVLTGGSRGGAGVNLSAANTYSQAGHGGFGGGGGFAMTSVGGLHCAAGSGEIGGGGGSYNNPSNSTVINWSVNPGSGGVGLILIQYKTIT